MAKRTNFTDEDKNQIKILRLRDHKSIREIGEMFNVSPYPIYKIVGKTGYVAKRGVNNLPDPQHRSDRVETMKQMRFVERKTLNEIGEVFGISRERVRQLLGKSKLPKLPEPSDEGLEIAKEIKPLARFWQSINVGSIHECWEWIGSKDAGGYGKDHLGSAHRKMYELAYGMKPKFQVLHTCNNPSCVNPAHLYDGTPEDNMRDRDDAKRNMRSKLFSNEEVIGYRTTHKNGGVSIAQLSREANVSYVVMHNLLSGKTYKAI